MNFYNLHIWSDRNRHKKCKTKFQYTFNLNIWLEIVGDTFVDFRRLVLIIIVLNFYDGAPTLSILVIQR